MSNVTPAKSQDQQHLELLAIFHYIFGGLGALCACFPLMYIGIGVAMLTGAFKGGSDGPPEEMGWIFVVVGAIVSLLGWTMSACIILAGRKLTRHEAHTFCTVVAVWVSNTASSFPGFNAVALPSCTLLPCAFRYRSRDLDPQRRSVKPDP